MWILLFTKFSVVKPLCIPIIRRDKMVRRETDDLNPSGLFKIMCQGIAWVENTVVAQLL